MSRPSQLYTIDTARNMMEHAITIAYGYKHNADFKPTPEELEKFEMFEKEMWHHYCRARYILRSMHLRAMGRPEPTGE